MLSILFIMVIFLSCYILITAIEYMYKTTFPTDRIPHTCTINQTGRYYTFNKEFINHGMAYDPWQDLFYLDTNAPQKNFGYHSLYDESMAAMGILTHPQKVYFDYKGQKWLLYLSKGQYGLACGAESALYRCADPQPNAHPDTLLYEVPSQEELLPMALLLRHNQQTLFTRKQTHWCLSGFRLGTYYPPQELTLLVRITIPSKEMRKALLAALRQFSYSQLPHLSIGKYLFLYDPAGSSNHSVSIRSAYAIQISKALQNACQEYRTQTKDFDHTIDRLTLLRFENPSLYKHCLQMGKPLSGYTAYLQSGYALSDSHRLR